MARAGRIITKQLEGPRGSRIVQFGDVVENVNTNIKDPLQQGIELYVGLDHLDPGSLRIERWGNVADGTTFTRRFLPGQVLFGKRRAYQRKAAVADFEGVCSGDILVFEAKGDLIPELLPYIVSSQSFFDHALRTSAGSLSPRTKWLDLSRFEFALPSKPDQHRIADIFRAATDAVNKFEEVQSSLRKCREGAVRDLRRLERTRSDPNTELDVPMIPLVELAEIAYGLTINPARRSAPKRAPYIRVANVQRGSFDLSEVAEVGVFPGDSAKFELRNGDVLVVEGHANVEEIGRAALWEAPIEHCLHQNHVLRVRCASDILPEYLISYLNGTEGRRYFRRMSKSTSGLYTINSKVLRNMHIPLLPMKSQRHLVDLVNKFETADERLVSTLNGHRDLYGTLRAFLLNESQDV